MGTKPTDPNSTGLGQRIVSAMATKLHGSIAHDEDHPGARVTVSFASSATATAQRLNCAASTD